MDRAPLYSRALTAYRDAEAPSPARQVVLLYEGVIRHLERAAAAIATGRIEDRFNHVVKAQAIIGALQSCLDLDRGGEIAPLLDRLYGHMLSRLMLVNLRNDPAPCAEVVGLLRRMREGWATLAQDVPSAPTPLPSPQAAARLSV